MADLLTQLRQSTQPISPEDFWTYISGSSLIYLYDPNPNEQWPHVAKEYDPQEAKMLEQKYYSPFWSLNVFKDGERKEEKFLHTLCVGVDIDVVKTADLSSVSEEEIDERKNAVLQKLQDDFPLQCHEVHETAKGLHILFLVSRVSGGEGLALFKEATRILIAFLGGDTAAGHVTQLLRFPSSLHQKNPEKPFYCRTLIDRLDELPAHDLKEFVDVLRQLPLPDIVVQAERPAEAPMPPVVRQEKKWEEGLQGVDAGRRNETATSITGKILSGLPEQMWEMVGWSGLKEWNHTNRPPLDERELRSVFDSIASRHKKEGAMLDSRLPIYAESRKSDKRESTITLQTIGDFLEEPEEDTRWVVDELLPAGGFSLCAAKPKMGKSTEARNLMRCIVRGEPYLGRATTQGKVLYLAFEEKRGEVRKQLSHMGITPDDPILLYIGSAPSSGLEMLYKIITEHQPILAIVDPLFLLLPVQEINSYAELSQRLDPLRSIARDTNCHILTTHHLSKMGGSGGDAVLGSTAIFGTVDTLMQMRKKDNGSRIIYSIQRYGTDLPETVLSFDKDSGLTAPIGELEMIQVKDAEADVLEALGNEEMEEREIREKAGGNTRIISSAIRSLVVSGKVTRSGEGKRGNPYRYQLAHSLDHVQEPETVSPSHLC